MLAIVIGLTVNGLTAYAFLTPPVWVGALGASRLATLSQRTCLGLAMPVQLGVHLPVGERDEVSEFGDRCAWPTVISALLA